MRYTVEEQKKLAKRLKSLDFTLTKEVYVFEEELETKLLIESLENLIHPEAYYLIFEIYNLMMSPIIIDLVEEEVYKNNEEKIVSGDFKLHPDLTPLMGEKRKEIEKELFGIDPKLRTFLDLNLLRSVRIGFIFQLFYDICDDLKIKPSLEIEDKVENFLKLFSCGTLKNRLVGRRYKTELHTDDRHQMALESKKIASELIRFIYEEVKNPKI